ncbi:MAG TPA: alkaline phytoceramidase [Candidatus Angelobacter sp.]|nr:alkaline phytoceramidase [Candidatus Angelobacter sp.]
MCLAADVVVAFLGPIAQPDAYHHFADQRTIAGIAHGFDVLSNFAFLISGLLGLFFIWKGGRTLDAGTRWAFATLFLGLILTSVGSAYYHLEPDNQRLVFDRLPMIIAMAGCVGAVLADRFGGASGWSVAALIAVGLWTVHHWSAGEQIGQGDLRWYALFQGLIILTGVLLLLLFPSRNRATPAFAITVAGNVAAKIFELLDKPVFALGGIVSGHTLKHLSAGLAFLPLVLLIRRIGQQRMVDDTYRRDLASAGSMR